MAEQPSADVNQRLAGRLARARLAVRAAMSLERLWPLLLPFAIVASLFVSLSWLGVFRMMPDTVRLATIAGLVLATLAALLPLRRFRRPSAADVDVRIERANQLAHNPVQVQADRPAGRGSSFSDALWREHQRRMAGALAGVGGDLPRTGVPERDPWGLRAVAALLLVTAFAFSFGPQGGRLTDAFRGQAAADVLPPRIDAWITPPPYTGKAPIYLTAEANRDIPVFTVPAGSELSLRVTGGSGGETLAYANTQGEVRDIAAAGAAPRDGAAEGTPEAAAPAIPAQPGGPLQFTSKLDVDGMATLASGETVLETWAFAVTPDRVPEIRFTDEPKRAVNGSLELRYEIEDDYGAASARAEFKLADPQAPGARPLYPAPDMALALPRRGGKDIATKTTRELTEHVWAGARANLTLVAVDDAGQEGRSETKTFVLPERPFTNPLAKAVIEQRRILGLDATQKPRVMEMIDAITLRPEDTFQNPSHYLGIMTGRTKLAMAETDDQLRAVVDYMWELALGIEEGDFSAAERRLRQAQEALKQALENGASDEELDALMKELREAMNEFLREFAERAQRDPNLSQSMPRDGQQMRQSDLDRMLDEIENLAKSGNRDQAQELLSQLQDMMNNLQAGRRQQPGQNGEDSAMREQMDKLGEIMRRQQEMMNETFRMDQMRPGEQGENGEGEEGAEGGQGMTPEEFAEALKQLQEGQGGLKGDLDALMKGLEGLGIQPGEGFGEAGDEMGGAEGALGEGEGDRAVGHQGRALEALRRGAQDMMQQMQQAMEGDQGGGQEGGRQQNADRDPLGRPRATDGPDFGDSVEVPDEIDVQRARQILEAIRKRLGNSLSPTIERDYLERLLELR
ncbi:MAG: TIGR02302 family protein [Rhizobiaceae bacterium]|nr:TIGR02302 family protein [Rhizobiaceae bacterium]